MPLHTDFMVSKLEELLNIPSPTGFTDTALAWIEQELQALGVSSRRTKKGALLWTIPGGSGNPRAIAAHVDTLVRTPEDNGYYPDAFIVKDTSLDSPRVKRRPNVILEVFPQHRSHRPW
jgi:acetylornithine deacetylase/succinyl-diaminopimelate desuccinylase-like protein